MLPYPQATNHTHNIKIMKFIASFVAALVLAAAANAQTTVIRVTGATAFRVAALDAIRAQFNAGGVHQIVSDNATLNASTRAAFRGTFPGITGTTIVKTTFNGSVEGIRAIALGGTHNPTFYPDTVFSASNIATAASPATVQLASALLPVGVATPVAEQAKWSFSDVRQASTPVVGSLNPSDASVGVVLFTMLANEGAPAGFTNVTAQQYNALVAGGFQPLSLFTGVSTDTASVFALGRNDGSGTRTTVLAETGHGIANVVNQYYVVTSGSGAATQIRRVPAGGSGNGAASTVWGQNVDGNGGYSSGSQLRTDMALTSAACEVREADNSVLAAAAQVYFVTFLSTGDAATAITNGAKALSYNGVGITPTAAAIAGADKDKVVYGQYTAWGYQQFYYAGSLNVAETTFDTAIRGAFTPAALGGSGVALSDMVVSRSDDGGFVAP
jgi:hypothetical protein